jgi:2-methylcitrate dehydratase PrpD
MSKNSPTAQLADYAAGLQYTDLSSPAVNEAKWIVLDTLGAMLIASSPQYSSTRLLGDLALRLGGVEECTVIGRKFRTSCFQATLINGTMGYAADLEGGGISGQHAAAVLVPTAIAMGESTHASGKALITALVAGYDVCSRASLALSESGQRRRGFHPSALCGHFGATATAGRFLELDRRQMVHALGLAASQASGLIRLWAGDPSEDSRSFVIGVAASNGVRSALLSQMGYGGPEAIFDEGEFNVYPAFSGEMHGEELTKGLGSDFHITQHDGFKRYACCGGIHAALDALFKITAEHPLAAQDVAQIVHRIHPAGIDLGFNRARSHNSPYMLSVALTKGKISPGDFLADEETASEIAELAKRIVVVGDPDLAQPGDVKPTLEVITRDGRRFAERVDIPRGRRGNPMSEEELAAKFMALATEVIPRSNAQVILDLIRRLEEVDDVASLGSLLAAGIS